MEIRYLGDDEAREVAPAGHQPFIAERLQWVDVPRDVVGHRPAGTPGGEGDFDPGDGLLAHVVWNDDGTDYTPLWETRAAKRAAATRAANDTAAADPPLDGSGGNPDPSDAAPSGEEG